MKKVQTQPTNRLSIRCEPALKSRALYSTLQRVIHLQMNKAAQLYLLMYQLVWEDKQHQKFWTQFGESLLYTLPSPAAWLSQTQLHTYTVTHSQERLVDDEDRTPRRGVQGRRGLGQVPNKGRGLSGRLGATQHSTTSVPPPHHYVSSIAHAHSTTIKMAHWRRLAECRQRTRRRGRCCGRT